MTNIYIFSKANSPYISMTIAHTVRMEEYWLDSCPADINNWTDLSDTVHAVEEFIEVSWAACITDKVISFLWTLVKRLTRTQQKKNPHVFCARTFQHEEEFSVFRYQMETNRETWATLLCVYAHVLSTQGNSPHTVYTHEVLRFLYPQLHFLQQHHQDCQTEISLQLKEMKLLQFFS